MANRIRELREERKLTVPAFARVIGMADRTVRHWESGRSNPTSRNASRIARALGISVSELWSTPAPATRSHAKEQAVIAAAIITRDGEVLLTRRRFREGELLWGFPSGAVEEGETAEQAAAREVAEELGFRVEATEIIGERIHPATKRQMVYIACRVVDGEPQLVDHEELAEFAWCTNDGIMERIPNGIFEPVQVYLDRALVHA